MKKQQPVRFALIAVVCLFAFFAFASYFNQNENRARLGGAPVKAATIEYAELEIQLGQNVKTSFDIALADDSFGHGSHSFGANLLDGPDYLVTIAFDYSSYVQLTNPFQATDLRDGHLIAFRVIRSDPNTMKARSSELIYALFNDTEILAIDDKDVKVFLRPSNGRNRID